MFWLARLIRLARPMPPTPTPAMFSMSLGGTKPRPSTCRGTIMAAAALVAVVARNARREIVSFAFIRFSGGDGDIIARSTMVCDRQERIESRRGQHRRCRPKGTALHGSRRMAVAPVLVEAHSQKWLCHYRLERRWQELGPENPVIIPCHV